MPPKASSRALKVWSRLGQWYGSRIAESYGDIPPPDWCALIDRTDDERLDVALMNVRRETPIHPPTLGQLEAALPQRRHQSNREDGPMARLVTHVLKTRQPCPHQVRSGWSWFGPEEEVVSKQRGSEVVRHVMPRGCVVPECAECGKPSVRALLDEVAA